jgi:hypothetical protein
LRLKEHWRSFEVERTGVFDRIIQIPIEVIVPNSDLLVKLTVKLYWLLLWFPFPCGTTFNISIVLLLAEIQIYILFSYYARIIELQIEAK